MGNHKQTSQTMRVSVMLQDLAKEINASLRHAAGEEIAFVLIVQADEVAQYVSNMKRSDGVLLIESMLTHWKAGEADIPAHYNPDL